MREFGNQAVNAWNSPWLPDHPLLGVEKADGSSRANTSVPPSDEELLKLTPATVHLNRTRHKDTDYSLIVQVKRQKTIKKFCQVV